jgi:uncharacterized protein (TIGR02265 family)
MPPHPSPPEHVVYRAAVEGLFVGELGARLDDAARAALRAAGLDLAHLEPAYPLAVLDACMDVVACTVFAELPRREALRELGRLQVRGFSRSVPGWLVLHALALLPTGRMLERLTAAWRNANNFIETRAARLPDGDYTLWVNDVGGEPENVAGLIEESFAASGHPARVEVGAPDGCACVYTLRF